MRDMPLARLPVFAGHGSVTPALYGQSTDLSGQADRRQSFDSSVRASAGYAAGAFSDRTHSTGRNEMNEDFYVGYLPKASAGLGKVVARITAGVLLAGLIAGGLLIFGQPPFATSKFGYGEYRLYAGVIEEWPYPMLVSDNGSFLLVAPGKHGLSDTVKGMQGKHVQLKGSLIERTPDRMIEVV